MQGRYEAGAAELEKAVALAPEQAVLRGSLGFVRESHGDLDGAIAAYREGVELSPADYSLNRSLGSALMEKKRFAEALPYLEAALRGAPDDLSDQARENLAAMAARAKELSSPSPRRTSAK
jgi:tetratricopeptide (TPR) repeat protein